MKTDTYINIKSELKAVKFDVATISSRKGRCQRFDIIMTLRYDSCINENSRSQRSHSLGRFRFMKSGSDV